MFVWLSLFVCLIVWLCLFGFDCLALFVCFLVQMFSHSFFFVAFGWIDGWEENRTHTRTHTHTCIAMNHNARGVALDASVVVAPLQLNGLRLGSAFSTHATRTRRAGGHAP